MATVRISQELRSAVTVNIKKMFVEQKLNAERMPIDVDPIYTYNKLFTNYIEDMEKLPECFFKLHSSITIQYVHGIPLNKDYDLGMPLRFPVNFGGVADDNPHVKVNYAGYGAWSISLLPNEHGYWDYMLHSVMARHDAMTKASNDEMALVEAASVVLNSCGSLAQALKVWPALWDVLPTEYRDKHNEKTEKKTRVAPVVSADLSGATGLLAIRKMTI